MKKNIKMILGSFFIIGWLAIYMYYPLHNSANKKHDEVTLIYALHDLKELQSVDVKNIKKHEKIGGGLHLDIDVSGNNVKEIFSPESLIKNGWNIVSKSSGSVLVEKKDYELNIVVNDAIGHLDLSAK